VNQRHFLPDTKTIHAMKKTKTFLHALALAALVLSGSGNFQFIFSNFKFPR